MQVEDSTNVIKIEIRLTISWDTFSAIGRKAIILAILQKRVEEKTNDLEEFEEPALNRNGV